MLVHTLKKVNIKKEYTAVLFFLNNLKLTCAFSLQRPTVKDYFWIVDVSFIESKENELQPTIL